jgi:hypothetical protein
LKHVRLRYVFMIILLPVCLVVSAQDEQVAAITNTQMEEGDGVEANYTSFPVRETISREVWSKMNPGKPFTAQAAYYKTFGSDPAKYAAVISKCNAYESFYINPAKPSAFSIEKGLYPINFQRNGEWIPIDVQLRPTGNNSYEAPDQWNPVGIHVKDQTTFIYTAAAKVQFNDWTLYGVKDNHKTQLAKADWSHYTIGADGMRIVNIFPGMDAEMRVSRGGIKTSFIIHQFNFTQYQELYFEDSFKGLREKGLYFQDGHNEESRVEAVYADVAQEVSAIKISPAIGYAKSSPSMTTNFPYRISNNKLSIAVSADYIINNLTTGDVVIDPIVQSANSIAQSLIGTMYNASCGFGASCNYTIAVTPPAMATITIIATQTHFEATSPCGRENLAYQVSMGTCVYPSAGTVVIVGGGVTGPGIVFPGYRIKPGLLACAPAPSCTPVPIDINFRLFRTCFGPTGCDNTCIGLVNPLAALIQGNTAEMATITKSVASSCLGEDITFSTNPQNGVPPYAPINWSYNASGTPSLGTGNSITTGAALTPGPHTIYANTTDACGTATQTNIAFTVKPLPVATLGTGTTICSEATTNIIPASSITGTTYDWTVLQTGVTGASNGTGTSIAQTLTNNGSIPGTAVYTITPTANGCAGSPITYTVTVNPVNNILHVDEVR